MPLNNEQAKRVFALTTADPDTLTPFERGQLRGLLRSANTEQRAAVVRALALATAERDPDDAYARGAVRAANWTSGGVTFTGASQPDNYDPTA